jgi:hypothetical protein
VPVGIASGHACLVGVDDWEHVLPWVRRAAEAAEDQTSDVLFDAVVTSLRLELTALYPSVVFTVYRRQNSVFVEWSGDPRSSELADRINVDPTYERSSGLEIGSLWGSDLPESLATVLVLLKHQP